MADKVLQYIEEHVGRSAGLREAVDFHIELLNTRRQFAIHNGNGQTKAPPSPVELVQSSEALARGLPILRVHPLFVDWNVLARSFQTICEITARRRPDQREELEKLVLGADRVMLEKLTADYIAQPEHSSLAAFVLTNALYPFLSAFARRWQSVAASSTWYRGYCPICGGLPDLAVFSKEGGTRRLLCSRCDHEWFFARSTCPFCGENQEGKLGYYPTAGGIYRLYVCDACSRYLKTIDERELARVVNMPAERILTIELDVAARQAGFH